MKKQLCMLLVLVLTLGLLTGCSSGKNTDDTDYAAMSIEELKPLIKTINEGKLTVVTSPDFAPYEFYALDDDGNPTLVGFDMALAKYIADYLGLELEVIPMDFDGTILELGAGKADIGLSGYSPDPDREKSMNFSDVYYTSAQSFVTVKGKAEQFQTLADANKSEYRIGAQIGSIQYKLALEHTKDADIVQLAKVTDIIAELLSGRLDGAFIETPVAQAYAVNYPELLVALDVPYEASGSVIGVNKENAALLAGVNKAIAAAIADGSLQGFIQEATELSAGNTYAGLLDEQGKVPESEKESNPK